MTYLEDVLKDIKDKGINFSDVIFILPSKRAGVFLKQYLVDYVHETAFAPEITSSETFVQNLSGLRDMSSVELLFELYTAYKTVTPEQEQESFDAFSKWGQLLLQDFNEIDRYLVDPKALFGYLSAIKELDHWSQTEEKTEMVSNYITFWNRLHSYYTAFSTLLLNNKIGYQGLLYREALRNLEHYMQRTKAHHVFIGFNALNTAEVHIFQDLLHNNLASIYWDIDEVFMNDSLHSASTFLRLYKTQWSYFRHHPFNWISSHYSKQKSIKVMGCPKSVGQSKYVGTILDDLIKENPQLNKTAVVLGDENLLIPVLNALPEAVKNINITMGFPLKSTPLASLFETLFRIHKTKTNQFYYKDVLYLLSHQMIQPLVRSGIYISKSIRSNNITYLTNASLQALAATEDIEHLALLFDDWNVSTTQTITRCIALIHAIKAAFDDTSQHHALELEYLYGFYKLFNNIHHLNTRYKYLTDSKALYAVYRDLLNTETLDFQGEPLKGLQIMGMLESRVLDFETVIITSVNEGILPAGKTDNSFIPFDVKKTYQLPTHKEKDAIYTYHFYRLLQRAKQVYLIYNTEIDALKGGEKSRFITQLDIEGIHHMSHNIAVPKIPKLNNTLLEIRKDASVMKRLKHVAEKGFSPSSLSNYIRNPIDFYYDKVLGIKDMEDVEETVAANTLGTVIHNTLQDFYAPLVDHYLTVKQLHLMHKSIDARITHHFKHLFKKGDITKGKNLIIYEVAKRYISNFLNIEKKQLEQGNTIKIIAIEAKVNTQIIIPTLDFPIRLHGEIDRVDEYNGVTRIIDYKSGKVLQRNLELYDWEHITQDYEGYSKAFQVLLYTYILYAENTITLPVEAGIISFKNLQEGFLKFAKKESARGKKQHAITPDVLDNFKIQLKQLILEICNPNTPFTEKNLDNS